MEEFSLKSTPREKIGRAASKKLRDDGKLPINIYGHKQENRHVAVDYREFTKFIDEGHRMLTLDIDGVEEHGVIKELQYDALGTTLIHADVARVDRQEKIQMAVVITTLGVAKGQTAGGTLDISLKEVHIEGPASSIPEKFEILVTELDINEYVRIKDLEVPPGCHFLHEPDDVILAIHKKRGMVIEETPEAEGPTEPELITKKKEDEEEGKQE